MCVHLGLELNTTGQWPSRNRFGHPCNRRTIWGSPNKLYKPFLKREDFMDVKGSSWSHRCQGSLVLTVHLLQVYNQLCLQITIIMSLANIYKNCCCCLPFSENMCAKIDRNVHNHIFSKDQEKVIVWTRHNGHLRFTVGNVK